MSAAPLVVLTQTTEFPVETFAARFENEGFRTLIADPDTVPQTIKRAADAGDKVVLWGCANGAGRALRLASAHALAATVALAPLFPARPGRGPWRPRPRVAFAEGIQCPTLVQVADDDPAAIVFPAEEAAFRARGLVRHYACQRAELTANGELLALVVDHQVSFLRRVLLRDGSGSEEGSAPDLNEDRGDVFRL